MIVNMFVLSCAMFADLVLRPIKSRAARNARSVSSARRSAQSVGVHPRWAHTAETSPDAVPDM
eukprot:1337607-Prymnesium_polylepis.1